MITYILLSTLAVALTFLIMNNNGFSIIAIITIECSILVQSVFAAIYGLITDNLDPVLYLLMILIIGGSDVSLLLLLVLKREE